MLNVIQPVDKLVPCWSILDCNVVFSLKMEATGSSETLISHCTTLHHNPEDFELNLHCCETFRSW